MASAAFETPAVSRRVRNPCPIRNPQFRPILGGIRLGVMPWSGFYLRAVRLRALLR